MKYKVIVADDEDVIRKGIVYLIDWDKLNCEIVQECTDGLQVLKYLEKNTADIVITDIKMPKLSGIELMEEIDKKHKGLKMILVTAYTDFEFARKALRYGAVDFVVKNDIITDLPKAVKKAVWQYETEKKEREKEQISEREYQNIQGYVLESLLLSKALNAPEDIERYGLNDRSYCVCSCEVALLDKKWDLQAIVQMLKNFLDIIENKHDYHIVNVHSSGMSLIISEPKETGLALRDVTTMCGEILRLVDELMGINIKFGVSTIIHDVTELSRTFHEAAMALSRAADSGNEIILYVEESESSGASHLNEYGTKITDALFDKNPDAAKELLEQMKQEITDIRYPLHKAKIKMINLCSAVFRRFGEIYVSDTAEDMESRFYLRISQSTTLYSLFQVCREMIDETNQVISGRLEKHDLVDQISRYISANYQSNITLQDIADQIHISSAYVSRLFRNKTGITITEAINRARIDQAKLLLGNPEYKVYEIAQMVGFEDAAYFTSVFTKYVGCSPNLKGLCKIFKDYREKRDEFLKKQLIALFCAIIL